MPSFPLLIPQMSKTDSLRGLLCICSPLSLPQSPTATLQLQPSPTNHHHYNPSTTLSSLHLLSSLPPSISHRNTTTATLPHKRGECIQLHVPDLLFFGESYTAPPERSESFQAQCLMRFMEVHRGKKLSLVGLSYGGFVGYSLVVQFKDVVEKVVICCAGVCLEDKDLRDGLFKVPNLEEAVSILLPQTPEKLKLLVNMSFVKPAKIMPNCFLRDFIEIFPQKSAGAGASDKRKMEEQKPKEQRPKANENKPVMNE